MKNPKPAWLRVFSCAMRYQAGSRLILTSMITVWSLILSRRRVIFVIWKVPSQTFFLLEVVTMNSTYPHLNVAIFLRVRLISMGWSSILTFFFRSNLLISVSRMELSMTSSEMRAMVSFFFVVNFQMKKITNITSAKRTIPMMSSTFSLSALLTRELMDVTTRLFWFRDFSDG